LNQKSTRARQNFPPFHQNETEVNLTSQQNSKRSKLTAFVRQHKLFTVAPPDFLAISKWSKLFVLRIKENVADLYIWLQLAMTANEGES
jgi:hypothetical protein